MTNYNTNFSQTLLNVNPLDVKYEGFKIHAGCMVKDEVDVIVQTLQSALEWCDFIYIYENGSTDGTAEKVLDLSEKYPNIVIYRQDSLPYSEGLRAEMYHHYKENYRDGDWICKLDADEIYIDNPRQFLAQVPPEYLVVKSASFQYYITDKDAELYYQNPSLYDDDVPVEQKCRYYINNWSEYRFFKYNNKLAWSPSEPWPSRRRKNIYPIRIKLKHYQYRSPQQITKRLENRLKLATFLHEKQVNWKQTVLGSSQLDTKNLISFSNNLNIFKNNTNKPWESRIIEASQLYYDNHDGEYVLREDLMPPLEPEKIFILFGVLSKNFGVL